ncbi:alpha/beta hydrolase (plasmid) [Rhizobium leguminosarum bv. trifolii]|uniref:alpha/beta fold hydrolase n=1 Tax=Rhizobium leguminosarum TaxID=384 RepID=UPI00140F71B6|nr:alpha/beta hydrolase [Rhizobium leguminosarum]QIO77355.1 alpha/beta hydrolase [Rhizobium leguminosarum bv. trifolii]QIO84375.1 alpha/beta hydrolase [Rhizobium leguminosarum bv. trifolii]QND18146.1 alpha/beta hydrolase [Rhizobium leguminosarum bv. trifolii]
MPILNTLSSGHHVVDIDGIRQSFHVTGKGPVIVVHPGGPGIHWQYLRMPLLERHFTMVYLEPIGTGGSGQLAEHPHGYTIELFANQLRRFLETLDISNVILLGHSHGGFVIQEHTSGSPDRVSGMILYSSSAVTGNDFMRNAANGIQAFADRRHADGPAVLQAWQSVPKMSSDDDYTKIMRDLLPAYFADGVREKLDLEAFRAGINATILIGNNEPFDARSRLQNLSVRTLILTGDHDFICGPKWGETLHDSLRNSELVRFAHSGHFAHLEQPEEFLASVLAFVKAHKLTPH